MTRLILRPLAAEDTMHDADACEEDFAPVAEWVSYEDDERSVPLPVAGAASRLQARHTPGLWTSGASVDSPAPRARLDASVSA